MTDLTPEQKRARLAELLKEKARRHKTAHPASDGQRALWFIQQTAPESSAYNVAFSARICSPVEAHVLQAAFQALLNRHATLRATFRWQADVLMQETPDYAEVAFESIDASAWSADELHARVVQAYHQPFNLETGPLARWQWFQRAADEGVLLITIHHIAVDAWSLWIVLEDLRKALQARLAGASIALDPAPPLYAEWSRWQSDMLASAEGEAHRAFWMRRLAGVLPVLNLPLDFPRPALQTYRGESLALEVPAEQTQAIKALAHAEGATLYMVLLALYQILLSRYTGQDDILIGTPTAGRNHPDWLGTVGYFVNPMVLRGQVQGARSFREHLAAVRQTVLEALAHQDYPFVRVVENLPLRPDPSRAPVFQCVFNLHSVQRAREVSALLTHRQANYRVNFGGLPLEPYFFPQEEGQFELALELIDTGEALLGTVHYHTDLFRRETAERFRRSFELLVQAVLENPDGAIAVLPILSPEARHQILVDWNQTTTDYPRDLCLPQLFETQAARTPNATAIIYEGQTLTYAQLNARANQLAHHLRALGVGPEMRVGVYLERSLEMMIALLGILKAGAAYIPMDPIFPAQRIGYMMEDSQMAALVTHSALVDSLPAHSARAVLLDDEAAQLARLPVDNLTSLANADSLAYVIFTSGSTGRPKGVQIPHGALTNFLLSMQKQPGLAPHDILASVTTLSFDIAGLELYLPLITGATVVILPADTSADGTALAQALEQARATVMQATPATWRLLVETGWAGRPGFKMLCGGEALPAALARQLLERGSELWNMYGPTETTIWSTLCRIQSADEVISIGRPIANTEVYILDEHLQPTPIGVAGQLFIGGDGLARGYLNRPDLTAEKFSAHPFRASARLYATGDLARYHADGRIECLGRSDAQIKLRGFRIELGEIEAVLAQHPAVQHAVVTVREDSPGDKRLAAYLILNAGATCSPRELRQALREQLPAYMVPAAYVFLEAFPLTPNGKIDRHALPAPTATGGEAQKAAQPPATPSEQLVADIWRTALGVEQVSVYDNFFDLGGHSLLAMQVIAQIQEQTSQRLNPGRLRYESLGQLAATLDAATTKL